MIKNQHYQYSKLEEFTMDKNSYYYDLREHICKNLQNRQYDDEQSSFHKFKEYKLSSTREDCDGSGEGRQGSLWLIREIYRKLWDWKDISRKEKDTILKEDINVSRYAISIFDDAMKMGPDTMNSYWTPLLGYLVNTIKHRQEISLDTIDFYIHFEFFLNSRPPYYSTYLTAKQKNEIKQLISKKFDEYKEQINKENIEDTFYEIAKKAKDYIDYKEQIKMKVKILDKSRYEWILKSKLLNNSNELQCYGNLCYTMGNMVLVPAGFNNRRTLGTKDYWDKSLEILYNEGFCNRNHDVLFKKDKYIKYINTFYLWEYVNSPKYKPLSLFKNNEYEEENRENIEIFYKSVNRKIIRRGLFMIAMLRIALGINIDGPKYETCKISETDWEVSKVYEKIMKRVFLKDSEIYSGYLGRGGVIESIRNILKDEDVCVSDKEFVEYILKELEEQIEKINEESKCYKA